MGGAERSARKRRQGERVGGKPNPVTAARKSTGSRKQALIGVAVVAVIAIAVVVGVIYTNSRKDATSDGQIAAQSISLDVPARRDGAAVLVGRDSAKVTIDVYEDFLCPACGAFEKTYAGAVEQKLDAGEIKVRYHMINLLNERSDPAGYSTDSANAALLAADEGKFLAFHKSLFASQPQEGARGWSKDQLIALGKLLGITAPSFADGVNAGKYDKDIDAAYATAKSDESLWQQVGSQKGFATPTVAVNNKVIETADPNWLTNATTG
ncbi:DsbA family protein [Actinokineospora enzanensis]|uniref:DsbA family protein n=1 Tax=Actinokineospora enzanensis TaxID=155975 RepID=UPI00036D768E|nr:thioredoxin domain-containing protein [Actinokineospora enzanensis]